MFLYTLSQKCWREVQGWKSEGSGVTTECEVKKLDFHPEERGMWKTEGSVEYRDRLEDFFFFLIEEAWTYL